MVELNEKLSFAALEPLTGFQTASSGAKQNFNSPAAPSGTLLEVSGLEGIVSRRGWRRYYRRVDPHARLETVEHPRALEDKFGNLQISINFPDRPFGPASEGL
jgi:hypothetical protein